MISCLRYRHSVEQKRSAAVAMLGNRPLTPVVGRGFFMSPSIFGFDAEEVAR